MDRKDLKKIKNYFSKQPAVKLVYLYGSQASGSAKKESDIDLAILVDEKKADAFKTQLEAMSDLSSLLNKEVEVQNLNICKTTFSYRVICEGKVIYARDEQERIDFELEVMRNYFDMKPFLDEFGEQIAFLARSGRINDRPFTY